MSDLKLAPKTSDEAAEFLLSQHKAPYQSWYQLCLKLQRVARGLPAVYPSALAAAEATPLSERVTRIKDLRRGMVGYCDDPNDGNPYGHIFFIIGKDRNDQILTWSNDVKGKGRVDVVPLEWYATYWRDRFQFGATWLNGYHFDEFNKPEATRGSLGSNYAHAIDDVKKAISHHEKKGNERLVRALKNDLKRMEAKFERLG